MDKLRQLTALTVVAVLAIVAGGWFVLVSPQRSKVTTLHQQAANQQQQNGQLSTEIARLKAESRDLPAEQARLAAIARQLPPNPAMPALVTDLTKAAKRAEVDLQVIAPQAPAAYGSSASVQLSAPVAPARPSGTTGSTTTTGSGSTSTTTPGSTSTTTSGSTATTTSGSAASTTPGASTLTGSAVPVGGLYQIPMSVTVVGTYYQVTQFINQLENLHRAYLVTQLNVQPGDPLAGALSAASSSSQAATGPTYSGKLTAKIDGFVFEVLTTAPTTGAATLPSTSSGH
ncbi:MAG: type 4a pilus biogenesis protein PilO [Frankiaceae bacterium]